MPFSCAQRRRNASLMAGHEKVRNLKPESNKDSRTRRSAPRSASLISGGAEIEEPRMWKVAGDDQPGEVHPALTAVERDAVGGCDDLAGVRQDVVGTEGQFHFHVPAGAGGFLQN